MALNLIVATDINNGFSKNGSIPWNIKEDLQYFKKMTLYTTVVMGRKTFETLGNRPLVNRENIVISSTLLEKDGYKVYKSIEDFLKHRVDTSKTVFFIGGKDIYEYALNYLNIDFIYKTVIHKNYECDLTFPNICSYKFNNMSSPVVFTDEDVKFHYEIYKQKK